MENIKYLSFAIVIALLMNACSDDSNSSGPEPPPSKQEEASAEKQFVYNAMNYWYYWQDDVADLADNRFDDDDAKQKFLMGFPDAETLFEDLQYFEDDFSFFIEDYEKFNDEQDGVYAALGFNYGFVYKNIQSDELFGYVRYIVSGSPAEEAGLERLQIFTKVDGTTITDENFLDLLTNDSAHELTLAHLETSSNTISFEEDSTISISSREVIEEPVYITKSIESNNIKIGYLMYNAFQSNSHQALNDAFGELQSQGAEELVLDLRYNGGGAVTTSQLLSSMITNLGCSDVFAEFEYNSKRSEESESVYFLDKVPIENEEGDITATQREGQCDNFVNTVEMNRLNLNRVFVLVSGNTASASEALINSLKPYIDVTIIGDKTIGKDEGSLTLYDVPEPYLDEDEANPDHKKAIQPIVLKIVNSAGADYPNGFEPQGYDASLSDGNGGCPQDDNDNCVNEITLQNLQSRPDLGTMEEPLFARAIELITGTNPLKAQKIQPVDQDVQMQEVNILGALSSPRPFRQGMYIEPFMMPQKK